MNKYIISLCVLVLSLNILAQESYSEKSDRKLLDKAIDLHNQNKYSVSTKYLNDFVKLLKPQDKDLFQEVDYYIACNAYETKASNAFQVLNDYVATYPYSPTINRIYFLLGKMHYDRKEYAEAIRLYKNIKNTDLNNDESNEYIFTRGYSHLTLKQYSEASLYFLTLSGKNQPLEIDATYYYGYSEFCRKNYNNAITAFEKIDSTSRYFEPTSFHILQIYDRQNEHQKTIEQGNKLLKSFPNSQYSSEAYRLLGESSYRNNKWDEVVEYLKKYITKEKKVQRSNLYMLGYSYYKTNNFTDAISIFGRVTSENDYISQNAYLYIGYINLNLNELAKAQMAFQTASLMKFDTQIKEEAAYNYTLAAYQNNSPFGETINAFERFIEEYPNSKYLDAIYNYLADVYINEKDYKSALKSINKINIQNKKIRQAKENALFQIGVNYFINENYDEALKYFDLTINEYTPNSFSAQAFLWRGETFYKLGNKEKCKENIHKFLSKTQNKTIDETVKAYYTLGYCAFEDKNYKDAERWFNTLTETKGADRHYLFTDVLNRLADCHYNKRDFNAARKVYSKVNPSSPVADYATFQNAFILGIQKQYTEKISVLENLLKTYRNSPYRDDALYEIGRTYVIMENYDIAIDKYTTLQTQFPKSPLARKASLEIGMLYANMNKTNQAISAFKHVIGKYPSSEETKVALESLQALYIEINKINDYLSYRESIAGTTISNVAKSQEDSLSFLAAERVYAKGDFNNAIQSLNNYIIKYCDVLTLNCISATFYLAESYYSIGDKDNALKYYDIVINKDGNSYMETSLLKGAEIAYDKKLYSQAYNYFKLLEEIAEITENIPVAKLGQLRCSYRTQQYQATINIANSIINNSSRNNETHKREARYCKAKSLIASRKIEEALDDIIILSENVQYEVGAEAKIIYANYLYETGNYDQSEKTITNFIEKNSPHQYWIARSLIILADIYIAKNDDFLAKQYLMSLSENYNNNDDISSMVKERLDAIIEREAETVI